MTLEQLNVLAADIERRLDRPEGYKAIRLDADDARALLDAARKGLAGLEPDSSVLERVAAALRRTGS